MPINGPVPGGDGGGATTLGALLDVTIVAPQNNQHLIYNSTSQQWENTFESGDGDVTASTDSIVNRLVTYADDSGKGIKDDPTNTIILLNNTFSVLEANALGFSFENGDLSFVGSGSGGFDISLNTGDINFETTEGDFRVQTGTYNNPSQILGNTNATVARDQFGNGTPIGVVTPSFIGSIYEDDLTDTYYRATGITNADWILLNNTASTTDIYQTDQNPVDRLISDPYAYAFVEGDGLWYRNDATVNSLIGWERVGTQAAQDLLALNNTWTGTNTFDIDTFMHGRMTIDSALGAVVQTTQFNIDNSSGLNASIRFLNAGAFKWLILSDNQSTGRLQFNDGTGTLVDFVPGGGVFFRKVDTSSDFLLINTGNSQIRQGFVSGALGADYTINYWVPSVTSEAIRIASDGQTRLKKQRYNRQTLGVSGSTNGSPIVEATAAGITVTLASADAEDGATIMIKDKSFAATGLSPITIDTEGAETIDQVASVQITVAGGSISLYSDGVNWVSGNV